MSWRSGVARYGRPASSLSACSSSSSEMCILTAISLISRKQCQTLIPDAFSNICFVRIVLCRLTPPGYSPLALVVTCCPENMPLRASSSATKRQVALNSFISARAYGNQHFSKSGAKVRSSKKHKSG